jgi:RNA polymerase sigma-70 factor (ECF subfamily)
MLSSWSSFMGKLTDAYGAARGAGEDGAGGPAASAVEETIRALWVRGCAGHPEIDVADVAFAAHLAACGAAIDPGTQAEDLYLVCAGLGGAAAAIAKLRRIHRPVLASYLRRIDGSPAFVDEVEQQVWHALLIGGDNARPKLLSYAGQGQLAGWIGIAAQRLALTIRRHEGAQERAHDGAAAEARLVTDDPEMSFIKASLRVKFREAMTRAMGVLEDRERMIYRLHLIDGLSLEAIAKIYGVSHSTVSRWLAKARETVIAEARRVLREEMDLSPEEFDSVAGFVVSRLDLSVSRILRQSVG